MSNSDIMVAYKTASGVSFTDRRTEGNQVKLDTVQNWNLLSFTVDNSYTNIVFKRNIKLCASATSNLNGNYFIDIVRGTQYLIYAWGNLNSNGDIQYHSTQNRSSTSLPLISTLNKRIDLNVSSIETYNFTVTANLSNTETTTYFCQMFAIPNDWLSVKRHLIRYETLVANNNAKYVHHWLIYECSSSFNYSNSPKPGLCSTNEWLDTSIYCSRISLGWAVGGPLIQDMPQDIAYPIGGSNAEFKYFYLQMHYDNPDKIQNVKDTSGVRLYLTKDYRPIEFGVLTVGAESNSLGIVIPPQVQSLSFDFYCRQGCTNKMFDSNTKNITVFATLPHTHLTGRQIYSKVIRNGKEVSYITYGKYYDFNYQYTNFLASPITILPGDEIKVTCVYNTMDRTSFTYGGESTHDEMCLDFLWYYPRSSTNLALCLGGTPQEELKAFTQTINKTGDIISYLKSLGSQKTQDLFQNFYNNASKNLFCNWNNGYNFSNYPLYNVVRIADDNACSVDQNTGSENSGSRIWSTRIIPSIISLIVLSAILEY